MLINCERPQNKEELFNLQYAALWNVIECIFGVLKCQFHILQTPLKYNMHIQPHVPIALCALHNFIHWYDPEDFFDPEFVSIGTEGDGDGGILGDGPADAAEWTWADTRCDSIAQEMWEDY